MTTNETYFFREPQQLTVLAEEILPKVLKQIKGVRKIKIWSAACSSGEEPYTLSMILLEKLGMDTVDLVMTDLNMPYMAGMELTKTLRADPDLSNIPILMVTVDNDDTEREQAYSNGVNGYLVKPVTGDAIAQNIKNIIQQFLAQGEIQHG